MFSQHTAFAARRDLVAPSGTAWKSQSSSLEFQKFQDRAAIANPLISGLFQRVPERSRAFQAVSNAFPDSVAKPNFHCGSDCSTEFQNQFQREFQQFRDLAS